MSQGATPVTLSDDDRRAGIERRRRPTPLLSRYLFIGRRRGGRRPQETRNVYVDRFAAREWILAGGIFVLSMLDLVFTLVHLDAGGEEANPVMDWFLDWGGTDAFSVAKILFTVIGLLVLLVHVRFDRVKGLMRFAFGLYAALFVFHLYVMYVRIG
jgi:hypothetical protein